MDLILDTTVTTATLMLVVIGLGVILGLMNVINLAHSGMMAIAVYAAVSFNQLGYGFWLSTALATLITVLFGAIIERLVIRNLYGRMLDDTILATWGISLIVIHSLTWIYGRSTYALDIPITGSVTIGGVPYSAFRIAIVGIIAVIVIALALIMHYTRTGLIVRMVMSNEPLARGLGVNTIRVRQMTFLAGAALAGFAGALLGPTQGVTPNYAIGLLPASFMAVLLAGRTLSGLVLASILLGVTQSLVTAYSNSVIAGVIVIFVAVIVLRLKPEGLVWHRA
jgi:branched-chain amino acid transport system permease protein